MYWLQRCSSVVMVLLTAVISAAQSNDPPAVRAVNNPPFFPFINLERAKPDLDRFVLSLQAGPESRGYYAVIRGEVACEGEEEYIAALIKGYLVRERGVSESRLVYVKGGSSLYSRSIATGLIPPGAKVPQAGIIVGYPATHLPYNSRSCKRLRRQWRRGAA